MADDINVVRDAVEIAAVGLIKKQRAELALLRAAGDALADTVTALHRDWCRCNTCVMARAWEEARRG